VLILAPWGDFFEIMINKKGDFRPPKFFENLDAGALE